MCLEEMRALAKCLSILAAYFARGRERLEVREEVGRMLSFFFFHLFGESAKPVFDLFSCQDFLNRGERPNMTERIANLHAIKGTSQQLT
jgi:hypothetical protein